MMLQSWLRFLGRNGAQCAFISVIGRDQWFFFGLCIHFLRCYCSEEGRMFLILSFGKTGPWPYLLKR